MARSRAPAALELDLDAARAALARYARIKKLASFGEAALARRIDDVSEVARVTGTSVPTARQTVDTGKALAASDDLCDALASGELSLDQAAPIAAAEVARPGTAAELLSVARTEAFCVLKDKARKITLEAQQNEGLGDGQRNARSARSYNDDLGMIHIDLALEPHVGTPIVNRAEAEASRLLRAAKKDGRKEPFERHLADAYAALLSGSEKGRGSRSRPELVVVVSHEVAQRGWKDVKKGEVCKIPGVGPVPPAVARNIAADAFLSGVFHDGKDLRNMRRWTRNIPIEVRVALELGPPPDFDGVRCVDCGNRFRNENDHVEPHVAGGPASNDNLKPRCWPYHQAKTARDRKAGKLRARKLKARAAET